MIELGKGFIRYVVKGEPPLWWGVDVSDIETVEELEGARRYMYRLLEEYHPGVPIEEYYRVDGKEIIIPQSFMVK